MKDRRRRCLAATLALLALATPMAARAQRSDDIRLEMLPLRPAAAMATEIAGLLNVPPTWTVLDAAAILVDDPAWPAEARDRLRAALLDQGAAVLELDPLAGGRGSDSSFAAQPPGAPDVLAALFGALLALRTEAGAGLVVAFGFGEAGEALLRAAEDAAGAQYLDFFRGPEGPRFAALASLGPGRAAFAATDVPLSAAEQWPVRAPLLCALVAEAVAEDAGDACRAALLPRRNDVAGAAPGALVAGR